MCEHYKSTSITHDIKTCSHQCTIKRQKQTLLRNVNHPHPESLPSPKRRKGCSYRYAKQTPCLPEQYLHQTSRPQLTGG